MSTYFRRAAALPVTRRYNHKVDAALADTLRREAADGTSFAEIGRRHHLSYSTVQYWCRRVSYQPLPWVTNTAPAQP